METNKGDVVLCELDRGVEGVLRLILSEYKGSRYLNFHRWFRDGQGRLYPAKDSKRLTIRRSELYAFYAGVARAIDLLVLHDKDEAQRVAA